MLVPEVMIEWWCYENAQGRCRRNVISRNRESVQNDLRAIDKDAPVYTYPDGCTPMRVLSDD